MSHIPPPDEEPLRKIAARRALRWLRREAETPLFARLLTYQACSAAGDTLVALALAGSLLFSVPNSEARDRVLLYLVFTLAPLAVVAPIMAGFLDRHRGGLRIALVASAAGRAACAWTLAGRAGSVLAFPLAFGVLALSRAALVARGAVLPAAAPETRSLVAANSSLAKMSALAGVVVLPVGVGLGRAFGAGSDLRMAAAAYVVAVAPALGLPAGRGRRDAAQWIDARRAKRPLRVRQAIVATAGLRFLMGFISFHLAFGLRREGLSDIGLGLLIGAAALGSLVGGVVAGRVRRSGKEEGIIVSALVVTSIAGVAVGLWFDIPLATALVFGFGIASGASKVAFDSLVQRATEEAARGWLFARYESVLQLAWVAGALIPVAISIPLGPGIVAAGAISVLLAVLLATGRARRPTAAVERG